MATTATTEKPRKAVKTLTVTNTSIDKAAIVSVPNHVGGQVATDAVAGFGDPSISNIPRAIVSYDSFTIQILDEGQTPPVPGTVGDVKVNLTYWDGTEEVTKAYAKKCTLTQVAPGTIQIDGEHKAVFDLTFLPIGGDSFNVSAS